VNSCWRTCGNSVEGGGRNIGLPPCAIVQLGVFTDSHNWPPGGIKARPLRGKLLLSFPQFHSTHHNNKLYNSQKLLTALTEVMMVVGKSNRSLVQFKVRGGMNPAHFHRFYMACGLYTL
jgi:hypothetical protein